MFALSFYDYFLKFIFIVFFHYYWVHCPPLPQQSSHCCPGPWVPFLFCWITSHHYHTSIAVIWVSIESVFTLLVSSVCSLDVTGEWNHVYVFVWLACFTLHNVLQVYSCCCKGDIFQLFWQLSNISLCECPIVVFFFSQ